MTKYRDPEDPTPAEIKALKARGYSVLRSDGGRWRPYYDDKPGDMLFRTPLGAWRRIWHTVRMNDATDGEATR